MSGKTEFDRQLEENRRAYESLRNEIRTKHAGKYVGMAFGEIIAVDADFGKVCKIMDALDPQPAYLEVFSAEQEPTFDAYSCYYQGEFLPWNEHAGDAIPTAGILSRWPSAPSSSP